MSTASALKQTITNVRARARINETEARRSGAAVASGFVLGAMEKAGTLDNVPDLFGLPKTVSIAIAAKLAASYAPGDGADYLNGIGDAAAVVALYQFGKGEAVDGVLAGGAPEVGRRRRNKVPTEAQLRALEDKLAARLARQRQEEEDYEPA